MAEVSEKLLLF